MPAYSGARRVALARKRDVTVPAPTLIATPSSPSITLATASGADVFAVTGVPDGVTATISPNDGRFVVSGTGSTTKVVRGLSAVTAGTINYTVSAAGAAAVVVPITVNAAAVLAPAYTFQRVSDTPLFTKAQLLGSMVTKGPYIYGDPVDVRNDPMYAGKIDVIVPYTSDHDATTPNNNGGMGQFYLVAGGDPRVPSNWKLFDEAFAGGLFANVTGTIPTGFPLFKFGTSLQTETFQMYKLDDGTWVATWQAGQGNGIRAGQLSLRATSVNGLSWTANNIAFLTPPAPQIGSNLSDTNNHTGYLVTMKAALLTGVPFTYFARSLIGGASESTSGLWGTNNPKTDNAWTYLGPAGGQLGRAVDSTPQPGTYGPLVVGMPLRLRTTSQGTAALANCSTSAFGAAPTSAEVFEYLVSSDGREAKSRVRKVLSKSTTSGSYAEGGTGLSGIIEYPDFYWGIEVGTNAALNLKAVGVVWSPKAGAPEVTFDPLVPAIPTGLTSRVADYRTIASLPAGFTELKYGTNAPTTTFAGTGIEITVDGAASPNKGAYHQFGDGFVPNNTEYVDILLEDLRSIGTNSRHFMLGFSTSNTEAVATADGFCVESHPTGAVNRLFRTTRIGGTAYRNATDIPGPGFGTLSSDTNYGNNCAQYVKTYGIRWFIKQGRAFVIRDGKIESEPFSLAPLTFLDTSQTFYPFFAIRGVAANSVERVGSFSYSIKAGVGKIVDPVLPYSIIPYAHLNYKHNVFRIGSTIHTSLAAFEADPRVTKDATGTLYQHAVDLSGVIPGGMMTEGTIQVLHTAQRPASGSSYIALLDDGPDGVPADELVRIGLTSAGDPVCLVNASSASTLTTAGLNALLTNGQKTNSVFSWGSTYITSNHLNSGTGDYTGTNTSGVNRLVVGGRDDQTALKYAGQIDQVIVWPARTNNGACNYFAAMS